MLWALFLFLSTLQRGDDPYAILGLSHDATAEQIRSAFRKIVFDRHPDINKDEDSYRIWLKANDAYEILSNAESKLAYDSNGAFSSTPSSSSDIPRQTAFNQEYFSPIVTQQIFPTMTKDGSEWLLFAFQGFDCPKCSAQMRLWEDLAKDMREYVKVGRIDISSSPDLAETLHISSIPQYLLVQLMNTTYKITKLGSTFSSVSDAATSIFKNWGAKISNLDDLKEIKLWLRHKTSFTHVLEVLETSEPPSIDFRNVASKLKDKCVFGFLSSSDKSVREHWGMRKSPSFLVFRGSDTQPIQIPSTGRRLLYDIEEVSPALFPELGWMNMKRLCSNWCAVRVGRPNETVIQAAYEKPFFTAHIKSTSSLAASLSLSEGKWAIISAKTRSFWPIESLDDPLIFVSRLSELFKSDSPSSTFKSEEKPLRGPQLSMKAILELIVQAAPFEIADGDVVMTFAVVSVPVPVVIIGFSLFVAFLFVFGVANHTRVKEAVEPSVEVQRVFERGQSIESTLRMEFPHGAEAERAQAQDVHRAESEGHRREG